MRFIRFVICVAICSFGIAMAGDKQLRHGVVSKVESWIGQLSGKTHGDQYFSNNSRPGWSNSSAPPGAFVQHHRPSFTPDAIKGMVTNHLAISVDQLARDFDRLADPDHFEHNVDRLRVAGQKAVGVATDITSDILQSDSVRRAFSELKSAFP